MLNVCSFFLFFLFLVFVGSVPFDGNSLSHSFIVWCGNDWILVISLLPYTHESDHERIFQAFFLHQEQREDVSSYKNDSRVTETSDYT